MNADDKWLRCLAPRPAARMRLFSCPYAGAGTHAYGLLAAALPETVEPFAVRLPGRESRLDEPPMTNMRVLVEELADAIEARIDRPYALFGHSMGARMAFDLARALRARGARAPAALLVSGCAAPTAPPPARPVHALPDDRLVAELRHRNGVTDRVLDDPEARGLFLPALRADLTLAERYQYRPEPPLAVPIQAFHGTHDRWVSRADMVGWAAQTTRYFVITPVSGGHFFVHGLRARTLIGQAVGRMLAAAHRDAA
ncbi:thioesterase [Micromonospora sp. KC606]|uniref:thioesterase II family protein n=1 Tax=Micromonospora sp. KC606 TaxID=2530379 RepID=UPI00104CE2EB|nr:thioesterase domain-containing protein [Micromonospora sp. KC606]TDC85041.1 thioesterase [Micromonospora sp. KC606]